MVLPTQDPLPQLPEIPSHEGQGPSPTSAEPLPGSTRPGEWPSQKVLTEWESLWFLYSVQRQDVGSLASSLFCRWHLPVAALPSGRQLLEWALATSSAKQPPSSKQSITSHQLTYSMTRSNVYSVSITWRSFQDPDALDFARKVPGGWRSSAASC